MLDICFALGIGDLGVEEKESCSRPLFKLLAQRFRNLNGYGKKKLARIINFIDLSD
jgi:hypothetical protein